MTNTNNSLIQLKLDPPPKFTGRENYEEWSKKFRNYLALSNPMLTKMLVAVAGTTQVLTTDMVDSLELYVEVELQIQRYYERTIMSSTMC